MYSCERCGYLTKYKSNLKNHFKRKNPCNPIISNISIETLKSKINQKLIKNEINQKSDSKLTPIDSFSKKNDIAGLQRRRKSSIPTLIAVMQGDKNEQQTCHVLCVNPFLSLCRLSMIFTYSKANAMNCDEASRTVEPTPKATILREIASHIL